MGTAEAWTPLFLRAAQPSSQPLSPCPQAVGPGTPHRGWDTGRWQGARAGVASRSRSRPPRRGLSEAGTERGGSRTTGARSGERQQHKEPGPPRTAEGGPQTPHRRGGWGTRTCKPRLPAPLRRGWGLQTPARPAPPAPRTALCCLPCPPLPSCPRCPGGGGPGARLARTMYLPKQPEDVHGVLPLVLPDGGLDLPQPPHPPHVGRRRSFPQHPGQLLRMEEQGGEVEVAPAALQPAGAGLLGALLLQAALPAQPGAHGRDAAVPRSGPGGYRALSRGRRRGRRGVRAAPPGRPRPGSPAGRSRRSRRSNAPGVFYLLGSLPQHPPPQRLGSPPLLLLPEAPPPPGLFCGRCLVEKTKRSGCCRDCSLHAGILGSFFFSGQTL